jgi:hypothetical protein
MQEWNKLADKKTVDKTINALQKNGIIVHYTENSEQAKAKFFELLPIGAEVLNMTSITLLDMGIVKEILESGKYNAIRNNWAKMDRKAHEKEMRQQGAAPDWSVGSVHAVTEEGQVVIASATGSQLAAHVYGAKNVIWVVGTQKIVKNLDDAMKRIYEHILPLEDKRARKAYNIPDNMPGSSVNKLLIFNKEYQAGRIHLVFVNENLGF